MIGRYAYALAVSSLLASTAATRAESPPIPDAPNPLVAAPIAGSARASKVIGSTVYRGDSAVGRIEDLLVDLDHASVGAVILSVGGILGLGDKLVAVPPGRIKVGSEARFTIDLSKEQLEGAPAFDLTTLR